MARTNGAAAGARQRDDPLTAATPLFAGPGELRALCRAHDWGATPLGPVHGWPTSLRTAAGLALASAFPMVLLWGEALVQVYNDGYRALMGAKHPAGLGQPTRACWPEVWHLNAPIYERVREGETVVLEDALFPITRSEGPEPGALEEAWFTLSYSPVPNDAGGVGGVLVTVFETTRQVRARSARELEREGLLVTEREARAEVEAARARSDAVLASIADAFYLLDRDWRFTFVNNAAEPLLQTTRDALIGRTLWEAFPGVVGSVFERPYREAMATGRVTSAEAYFEPLGTWFDVRTYPWVGGVMVHFRDVGARKAAEAERERLLADAEAARREAEAAWVARTESERQFRTLADAIPTLAWTARPDGHIDWYNARWYEYTGTTPEQMEGWGWQSVHDPAELPWILDRWRTGIATGEPVEMTFPLRGADGRFRPFLTRIVPLRDADGRVLRWFGTNTDVSAERAAREAAEAANRAKSEFLAVMSHELRTPLNAIGGYAELMEMGIRGPVTPQQREDLGRIQRSQRHLLGLVNEVLNYAKLETGTVRYDVADAGVGEALAGAEGLVAPQARARGLALAVAECPADLAVRADPEKLRQVLVNLLSNAVKFTESGGRITVACAADGARVRIAVQDTGAGIAADQLGRIFEPFVQVRADLTRPHEGAGLGLAISRDLARGMGGELTVESTLGQGSTFTLTLPQV